MTRPRAAVAAVLLVALACTSAETGPAPTPPTDDLTMPSTSEALPSPSDTPAPTQPPTAPATAPTDAAATPPPPARPRLRRVDLEVERVAGLTEPTALAVRPGDDGLYVTERPGRIRVIRDGEVTTVLDWRRRTKSGHEQGMLGLAFSPDGDHLYVYYIGRGDEHSRLDQYAMEGDRLDRRSRREVLVVRQPEHNVHKGGQLSFGPDGMLYLALGDGGPSDDPPQRAQRLGTLLGKIIRIRPTPNGPRPYRVPRDNPFTGRRGARGEIWAYGLRNPWRFSFDRDSGDLWIGDVGRYVREGINVRPADADPGANFGWPALEGTVRHARSIPVGAVPPLHEYPHDNRCAVVGGYVYRGTAVADLRGAYLYGDFCDGRIRALVRRRGRVVDDRPVGPRVVGLTSFGEDADGELYVLSLRGGLLRLH